VTALAGWGSVRLTDDLNRPDFGRLPTPNTAGYGSPVVYLDGPLEAHNEVGHASHRQIAHPRTAAIEHRK
jgi:hypothetical protein